MCCFRRKNKRGRDNGPYYGATTIFSFVMIGLVSAAMLATAVAGSSSGTLTLRSSKPHHHHHKSHAKAEEAPLEVEISDIEKVPSFVINLDGKGGAGRLAFFSHHVGKKRHMFQNMCRFSAVDMRKCTDPEKHEKYIKPPLWDMNRRPGAHLGCGMSHRSLWQHIVDNKIPVAVVMEDDVHRFSDDFDALYRKAMASLLKKKEEGVAWHVFRFAFLYDNNHWINRQHLNSAKNMLMLNQTIPRRWIDDCHYPRFYQHFVQDLGTTPLPFWAFGSGMYAITYEGAQEALARFNALTDTVDSFAWAPKTNCYLPAIATADGNGTTRFAPNAVVKKDPFLETWHFQHQQEESINDAHPWHIPTCDTPGRKIYRCEHIPDGLDIPPSASSNTVMGSVLKGLTGYLASGSGGRHVHVGPSDVPRMKVDGGARGKIDFNRALAQRYFGDRISRRHRDDALFSKHHRQRRRNISE